jgi:hypothetical protein
LTAAVPNPFASLLRHRPQRRKRRAQSAAAAMPTQSVRQATQDDRRVAVSRAADPRRAPHGWRITVQVAYAWSRTMIETGYLNESDTQLERVISNFDREHTLSMSGIVEVPVGRDRRFGRGWSGVKHAVLGGWQVGYIFKAQSGAPLGFGNFLFAEGKGVDDIMADNPTVDQWFDVTAFNRVSAQQLVSNIRTQPSRFAEVRGPGYAVLDLSLLKNVSLGGSRQLQLRLEAYNVTNRVNLRDPNTGVTNNALRTIT